MKHLSLAARYRPQTFNEVAGQELAAAALSRAAAESCPAPAYLLSGTRGVGKTTIARIFAKALNCDNGPGPEPCNHCVQCDHITQGSHVDVCEIDGASNTGVDDIRALRENLGYMPMEGRFKIFIIDEAHMLSKSAFNALLKTLEEPPAHSVFIFATTEAHRFPATIISRCQHFVFRHLSEDMIFNHLGKILEKENIPFEDSAIRLIAKRASGSLRDSLSLLDQTLAIGNGKLTAESARKSLGLAGQEFYNELLKGLVRADCARIAHLCRELLQSGVDIGFFTRELAGYLRNLFLLRQGGEQMLSSLGLSQDEAGFTTFWADKFTASHLHAAWQMVLENQRGITQSPEPGTALELMLLNLALLPKLLPAGLLQPSGIQEKAAEKIEKWQTNEEPVLDYASGISKENAPAKDWASFLAFCSKQPAEDVPPVNILRLLRANWQNNSLTLEATSHSLWERAHKHKASLYGALERYCGGNPPELFFPVPEQKKSQEEMLEECAKKPEVRLCAEILGASVEEWREKPAPKNTEK